MSHLDHAERAVSRRKFLAMGGALAAAGTVGSWVDPRSTFVSSAWPKGPLVDADAVRVRESQFLSVGQFRHLHKDADRAGPANQRGLRATGSEEEARYVDGLREQLEDFGVVDLHFESVPMRRWTTTEWSLDVVSDTAGGPVKTASYIPYSGQTPPEGVTGSLVFVPRGTTPLPGSLVGKIALFDVPIATIPMTFWLSLTYPGRVYDPAGVFTNRPYKRPFNNGVGGVLSALEAAGAAGAVGVIDYPYDGAYGSYFPYDGNLRNLPGLYVDRHTGAALKEQARRGSRARLTLPAEVKQVDGRNLIGFIPGQSDELVALHSHTDGTNAIEDDGPGVIVAISHYLTRLPREALPRTIMILLTTGHFAGGSGARAFLAQHQDDVVKRTNAVVTIEHVGTYEWDELPNGEMGPTGRYEIGGFFQPGSVALVDSSYEAVVRGNLTGTAVERPLSPNRPGVPPAGPAWPGEGQYLYRGGLADANYITGPTYLLNWGIETTDKVDFNRVRSGAIAFTEQILRLGRTPADQLRTYAL